MDPTAGRQGGKVSWSARIAWLLAFAGSLMIAAGLLLLTLSKPNRPQVAVPTTVERLIPSRTRPVPSGSGPATPRPEPETGQTQAIRPSQTATIRPTRTATTQPSLTATARPSRTPTSVEPSATHSDLTTLSSGDSREPIGGVPFPILSEHSDNQWRFGVAAYTTIPMFGFGAGALNAGWYMAGQLGADVPPGAELAYNLHVRGATLAGDEDLLLARIAARPGTLWQLGNEPDVIWQANCTPEEYAQVYHELFTLIKQADPTARVAIGAISQPTPLRLEYLDLILAAYLERYGEPMPIEIWTIHNAILREERGGWGVDIPPGIAVDHGRLYAVEDSNDQDIFRRHLVEFRAWMRDRGFQDRPLLVTEFGILMPPDYGFLPQQVKAFLEGTFDIMLTATDEEIGYPADDYRLVQRWAWWSHSSRQYPSGNLFDPDTKEITLLGWAFADYAATH